MAPTDDIEAIKETIRRAFTTATRPAPGAIHESIESDEAGTLLEADFAGVTDWRDLNAGFLDQAPAGYGSALSFFSDEAFRYFLPAYLLADLDDRLDRADPTFHLCHGLTDPTADQPINPRRYGDRTWSDAARSRLAGFTPSETAAVAAYLEHRAVIDEINRDDITQALTNFWQLRGGTDGGS
jgi:hypothetical protein